VRGKLERRGVRECEDRFGLIRDFCAQFQRPFTILDLGANLGYFSLRLTEVFDCTSFALEGVYGGWLEEVLEQNNNPRVILARKNVKLADLRQLAEVEHFDVVLALSVIHHLDGGLAESLEVLRSLGDHVILELPFEANACGQQVVREAEAATLPPEAVWMGFGKSHLAEGARRIVRLSRPKTRITKSYLGSPREDLALTIHSDWADKQVEFHHKRERRRWLRGINLQTYLWFNGVYPRRAQIAELLRYSIQSSKIHRDIQPWNIVLQGDTAQLIDWDDPNHGNAYDDQKYLDRLWRLLRAEPPGPEHRAPAQDPAPPAPPKSLEFPGWVSQMAQPAKDLGWLLTGGLGDTIRQRNELKAKLAAAQDELQQARERLAVLTKTPPTRRPLPFIVLIVLPKSGGGQLAETLRLCLNLFRQEMSGPAQPLVAATAGNAGEWTEDKIISQAHFDASPGNLQLVKNYSPRLVLHLRDPRQTVLAWARQRQPRAERGPPRDWAGRSAAGDLRGDSLSELIDWQLANRLPNMLGWMEGWLAHAETGESPVVLLTEHQELSQSGSGVIHRILDFYQIPDWAQTPHGASGDWPMPLGHGAEEEWREVFNSAQQEICADLMAAYPRVNRRYGAEKSASSRLRDSAVAETRRREESHVPAQQN